MRLSRWVEVTQSSGGEPPVRLAVITVHGMKTTGGWQKEITGALFDADIRPAHIDFGFRLIPSVDDVIAKMLDAEKVQRAKGIARVSVIAHSLGSLAAGRALEEHPSLTLDRLILWGSILPRDFPWPQVERHRQVASVLHEWCPKDPWPGRARLLFAPVGAGDSGSRGFRSPAAVVHEMAYEKTGHSNLGTEQHCVRTWIPFLTHGHLPPGCRS